MVICFIILLSSAVKMEGRFSVTENRHSLNDSLQPGNKGGRVNRPWGHNSRGPSDEILYTGQSVKIITISCTTATVRRRICRLSLYSCGVMERPEGFMGTATPIVSTWNRYCSVSPRTVSRTPFCIAELGPGPRSGILNAPLGMPGRMTGPPRIERTKKTGPGLDSRYDQ